MSEFSELRTFSSISAIWGSRVPSVEKSASKVRPVSSTSAKPFTPFIPSMPAFIWATAAAGSPASSMIRTSLKEKR
ncbi:MAG: hypothetical protein H6730_08475 [Deltaproteobacteria bacterium]|nr:hypothetical protein [Deltaproteobacteria bacterium]